ncbi:MAG: DUF3552 domain-containing protein, partial [Phycisphaerales bacterium]|nr:DUF3552 domain-containing protein [Phycisphaerales bacterium]
MEALTLFIAADDWLMPGLIGTGVGILIGILAIRFIAGVTLRAARKSGEQIIRNAEVEADALTQRAELESEKKATKRKAELEREIEGARGEIKQAQARLATREDRLDKKLESITERETRFDRQEQDLKQRETDLNAAEVEVATRKEEIRRRLEQLSGMTEAQARELFMDEVRNEADHEASILTQQIIEEAETEARGRSREITL